MITSKDVFSSIEPIQKVVESEDNKFLWNAVYKAIYMCVRLLLDIRSNQVQLASKLGIKLDSKKPEVPNS